ncbi:uncharacterized protein LOC114750878 [Neltuma alba]|uniref:uncharacterized protein LOC114750878 n=1 Tax=Neltuma alba TaxID=207710 RepID=UPI0010A501EE|nr:uncharacterized protein LOC114750878 [Prosopis alba]
MKFLFWNSKGTGSKAFLSLICELSKKHNIDILAILETISSGNKATKITQSLGFDKFSLVDAHGYSGGLWVLWKKTAWSCRIISTHEQYIHFYIEDGTTKAYFTAIYASPNPIKRRTLWQALGEIHKYIDAPWHIGKDFNSTLYVLESASTSRVGSTIDCNFSLWVTDLGLISLAIGIFFWASASN